MGFDSTVVTTFPCETFLCIVGVSGKVAVGCVVIISGEIVVGGIVGISVEVTVGGVFSFGAMTVGGGNVAVGLGFDSTVVTTFPCETFLCIVGVSGKVAVGCVVIISGEVVVGGIVGISVEVTVGGIFSFGVMAVGVVMSQLVWVLVVLLL